MSYLLCSIYNSNVPFVVLFLISTPEYLLVVTSHSIHLTSLSIIILRVSNPGEGRTRPHWLSLLALEFTYPSRVRILAGLLVCWSPYTRSGLFRGPSWVMGMPMWYKDSSSWIPSLSSLVSPAAVAPEGSQSSWVLSRPNVWMIYQTDHVGKGLWHLVGTSFPLFNTRFWLAPCCCLQRSRNVSNILKDQ